MNFLSLAGDRLDEILKSKPVILNFGPSAEGFALVERIFGTSGIGSSQCDESSALMKPSFELLDESSELVEE